MDEYPFYFSCVIGREKKDICILAADISSSIAKFKKGHVTSKNIKNIGIVTILDCNSNWLAAIDFKKTSHKREENKGGRR